VETGVVSGVVVITGAGVVFTGVDGVGVGVMAVAFSASATMPLNSAYHCSKSE